MVLRCTPLDTFPYRSYNLILSHEDQPVFLSCTTLDTFLTDRIHFLYHMKIVQISVQIVQLGYSETFPHLVLLNPAPLQSCQSNACVSQRCWTWTYLLSSLHMQKKVWHINQMPTFFLQPWGELHKSHSHPTQADCHTYHCHEGRNACACISPTIPSPTIMH